LGVGHERNVAWNMRRKRARTRVAPGDGEWELRQRQHQGAADVPGTEQIKWRDVLAEAFEQAAVAQFGVKRVAPGLQLVRRGEGAERPSGPCGRDRDKRAGAFRLRQRGDGGAIARVKPFEGYDDASAAALAEIGTERLAETAKLLVARQHGLGFGKRDPFQR